MTAKKPYFVNVNSHKVKANGACALAGKKLDPVLSVRHGRGGKPKYTHAVEIKDDKGVVWARLVYEPFGGLSCGARVFLVCQEEPGMVGSELPAPLAASPEELEEANAPEPDGMNTRELLRKLQVFVKTDPGIKVYMDGTPVRQLRRISNPRRELLLLSEVQDEQPDSGATV